jgi:anti-sigma regulatory factor (Ser/Thr protein kinase)
MTRSKQSRRSSPHPADPGVLDSSAELRIESTSARDLARVHPWFDAQAQTLPSSVLHAMRVALEEAVMNAAMLAFPTNTSGEISVRLRKSSEAAVIVVEYAGCAFDPTAAPAHTPPARPPEFEPGGLGLVLLRHYRDDIAYQRVGECNRLTPRFPLQPTA